MISVGRYFRRRGVEPDAVAFGTIIGMCARRGELERAFSLFRDAQQCQVQLTHELWTIMIRACAQRRDYYPDALQLLHEMQAEGWTPTTTTFGAVLEVTARRRDAVAAQKVWDILTSHGQNPPRGLRHYTTLLSAYRGAIQRFSQRRSRRESNARRSLRSAAPMVHNGDLVWAQMLQNAGVTPDVYALNAYLGLHAAASHTKRVLQILPWFDEFRVHKNVVTFNILAELYVRTRQPARALALRGQMEAEGVVPNSTTFRYWVTAAVQAALRAREFTDHGVQPSEKCSDGLKTAAQEASTRRAYCSQMNAEGQGQEGQEEQEQREQEQAGGREEEQRPWLRPAVGARTRPGAQREARRHIQATSMNGQAAHQFSANFLARREQWLDVAVGLLGEMWMDGHIRSPAVPFYHQPLKTRERLRPHRAVHSPRRQAGHGGPTRGRFPQCHHTDCAPRAVLSGQR